MNGLATHDTLRKDNIAAQLRGDQKSKKKKKKLWYKNDIQK